jgi:uncharacterized protein YwgA
MKPLGRSSACDGTAWNRPATVGSFLSRVWYRVIRCRFDRGWAGVERSCHLPLSREQIALVMLALADGRPFTPVRIQKALFLASDKVPDAFSQDSRYTFQPYDYGPFDRRVYSDVESLQERGLAQVDQPPGSRWRTYAASAAGVAEGRRLAERLNPDQRAILERIVSLVHSLSFNELVSAIYRAYPPMRANSVFNED